MSRRPDLALATVALIAGASPGCTRAQKEYAGGCPDGQKACAVGGSLRCVLIDDSAFGCAPSTCDPCVLDHATAVCQAGACAVGACEDGYDDCDSLRDNGCEADLATDPEHCGSCQTPCELEKVLSASCAAGKCGIAECVVPYLDCNGEASDGCEDQSENGYCPPELILQTDVGLAGVAVDEEYVFFAVNGQIGGPGPSGIRKVDKHGSYPDATDEEVVAATGPLGVAIDGDSIVFADGSLFRVPKSGGTPASLGPAPFSNPLGVAVIPGRESSVVYWTNFVTTAGVAGVWKLEGGSAYGVEVCSAGCAGYSGVAVSEGELFWAVLTGPPSGGVFSKPLPGETGSGFGEPVNDPVFVAADEHYVYWTTWTSATLTGKLLFRGRAPDADPIAELADVSGYGGVAVDESFVYFGELMGKRLKRLRKPLPP